MTKIFTESREARQGIPMDCFFLLMLALLLFQPLRLATTSSTGVECLCSPVVYRIQPLRWPPTLYRDKLSATTTMVSRYRMRVHHTQNDIEYSVALHAPELPSPHLLASPSLGITESFVCIIHLLKQDLVAAEQ